MKELFLSHVAERIYAEDRDHSGERLCFAAMEAGSVQRRSVLLNEPDEASGVHITQAVGE